jgi:NADH-quinone oxidoreductase subunit G
MATDNAVVAVENVTLIIDGFEVTVPKGTLVIRAAEELGIQIPRFCDHPLLDPAGACRQCLVDIEINGRAFPKPQASCTIPVENGMIVKTQLTSPVADKAQKGIMELLLINHPLDCPVCDKGGECPLQNQSMSNGREESRYEGVKRTYEKPLSISSQVLLDRERCVLCARCTRFSEQIAGDPFITLNERGALQQVGIYEKQPFESYFSGNTIQICPVGALTSASYRFNSRPFDLVSTPSGCEHCASGCALRTDVRRGKVQRRLAGDDSTVNNEWNCDKGRFAFAYTHSSERISTPLVRDANGELREASWPEAIAAVVNGLKGKRVGVLVGGRLTREDAYAYSKFARVALGTNDIDFRARVTSDEERDFISTLAGKSTATYLDIDSADHVVLVGFEPEDESPIVFLRLYKQIRKRSMKVSTVASFVSRGSEKLRAQFFAAKSGDEVAALSRVSDLTANSVILVGERASETPGLISAARDLAKKNGSKLAWIPRRAGERGALEAGALGTVLPGGRPVADAQARVDVAAAWGVSTLPAQTGKTTTEILDAASERYLDAVLVGGVDPMDISSDSLNKLLNTFVVSLEISHSAVTAIADVVLPVAAVAEKSGSFVDWQGHKRNFTKALHDALMRSDLRILSMIAEQMGTPINLASTGATAREIDSLGNWDGAAYEFVSYSAKPTTSGWSLSSHRDLLDAGALQLGEENLAKTARDAVAKINATSAAELGVKAGDAITISTERGSLTLPVAITNAADKSVSVPRNSQNSQVINSLGIVGGEVMVSKA